MDIMKSLANKISFRVCTLKSLLCGRFLRCHPTLSLRGALRDRIENACDDSLNDMQIQRLVNTESQALECTTQNCKFGIPIKCAIQTHLKSGIYWRGNPESKTGSHQKGRCDSCILKDKNVLLTQFSTFETNDPAHKTTGMGNHPPRPSTHQTFPTQEAACHWTEMGC